MASSEVSSDYDKSSENDPDEAYDYSILVTGVTGSGKSSLCNFICSEEIFKTNEGFASVTAKTGSVTKKLLGNTVRLIDTPGFCDEYETDEEHMKELGQAIFLARKGVNAIGFTINASGRFTKNDARTIHEMSQFKDIWPFTFIVFTNAAGLGEDEQQQHLQLQKNLAAKRCPKSLQELIKRVNNRYVLVESVEPTENPKAYHQHKVRELLQMVYRIYDLNNQQLYTNELFAKAGKLVKQAKQQKLVSIEQMASATAEVRVRTSTLDREKAKRKSFENRWWSIERKRKSFIETVHLKKQEAITLANLARQAAIEKAELDYKEAVANAEREAEKQTKSGKDQESAEKRQLREERDKDITQEETLKKQSSLKFKDAILQELRTSMDEDACDEALQKLKQELKQLHSQNKELKKQRTNSWYNLLSKSMTGKECVVQ